MFLHFDMQQGNAQSPDLFIFTFLNLGQSYVKNHSDHTLSYIIPSLHLYLYLPWYVGIRCFTISISRFRFLTGSPCIKHKDPAIPKITDRPWFRFMTMLSSNKKCTTMARATDTAAAISAQLSPPVKRKKKTWAKDKAYKT